jgi:non-heme Fe2+,alpha-ketoglutarate-dependent halogenase
MKEMLEQVEREVFEGGETGFTPGKWPVLTPSRIYEGRRAGRDRHLDLPAVLKLATAPGVAEQVAQILNPDLLLWRTQLLPKPPGSPETAWHQATTFTLSGQALRPVMEPPDLNELFNVTAWLALEDVDRENGCMQFWRGSHKKPIHNVWIGRGQFFGASSFELEADIPEGELTDIVLKAGEFIIFHERTVHGALTVKSQTRRRFGMNYRICRPDVYVYRGMKKQYSNTFGEVYDLAKWTTILLRGEDRFKRNRVMTIAEAAARIPTLPAVEAASPTGGIAAYSG